MKIYIVDEVELNNKNEILMSLETTATEDLEEAKQMFKDSLIGLEKGRGTIIYSSNNAVLDEDGDINDMHKCYVDKYVFDSFDDIIIDEYFNKY